MAGAPRGHSYGNKLARARISPLTVEPSLSRNLGSGASTSVSGPPSSPLVQNLRATQRNWSPHPAGLPDVAPRDAHNLARTRPHLLICRQQATSENVDVALPVRDANRAPICWGGASRWRPVIPWRMLGVHSARVWIGRSRLARVSRARQFTGRQGERRTNLPAGTGTRAHSVSGERKSESNRAGPE